ncbi:uncharacterized protein KZ484_017307 isoform 2-T2 [Pholidichthys leucotaenia]
MKSVKIYLHVDGNTMGSHEKFLQKLKKRGSHQVIVVAMHHTFDTNYTVPDKQMDNHPDVLIVNCLFYDNKGLLSCKCNKESRKKVCKKLELKTNTCVFGAFSGEKIHKMKSVKIYPRIDGNTMGSHEKFLEKLKKRGAKVVESPNDCNAVIVFCPIVSRFETDINAALSRKPEGSHQVIVVAMHHTFDKNHIVPDKQMDNHPDVLIVNCLFYDNEGLLSCKCNKESREKVCKKLELKTNTRVFGAFSGEKIHKMKSVKIYPRIDGNTMGSHEKFLEKLKKRGAKVVESPNDCDAVIVFCPIVSRFETDINAALSRKPEGSHQVIVVAMHHTFDKNHIVPDKQMDNHPDVLIVNCLFYDNEGLLSCKCNKESRKKVCEELERHRNEKGKKQK